MISFSVLYGDQFSIIISISLGSGFYFFLVLGSIFWAVDFFKLLVPFLLCFSVNTNSLLLLSCFQFVTRQVVVIKIMAGVDETLFGCLLAIQNNIISVVFLLINPAFRARYNGNNLRGPIL